MTSTPVLLVIEDDPEIQRLVAMTLATGGMTSHQVRSAEEALEHLRVDDVDLVLMDLGLPGMGGEEVITKIDTDRVPVIVMTVRDNINDKIRLFENGVVDYLVKPFDPMELLVRVRAALRRSSSSGTHSTITVGPVGIDTTGRTVTSDGREVRLTPKEYDLLVYLAENQGVALAREQILFRVWGYDSEVSSRTVDIHVGRLRSKIPDLCITTLHRTGYRLEET